MVGLSQHSLLDSQVGALKECIDLCRNGYIVQVQHYCDAFWYMRLRHMRNGRNITIWWERGFYSLKEGAKLLKQQDYPDEVNA